MYFVSQTQTTESGVAQNIFQYNTRDEAAEAYHATSASNYAAAKVGPASSFACAQDY